ncbi:hypothetical protein JYU34_015373 [Plutella xylostella]|uniref:Uncharacterized protein n=1 Tax=Plutella xylostella TaxID=51655 RepID=A0ABQ7Q8F1_PLUXY|nr:hypothetical protein JYU34_015373 [Plutella xylostella]
MGKKRKRSRSRDSKRLRKENRRLKEMLKRRRLNSSPSEVSQDSYDTLNSPIESERGAADGNTIVLSPMHADEVVDTEIINEMDDRETEADLDPEILQILGDDPSNENKFGEDLHNQILRRWKHILAKGLDKEVKSELYLAEQLKQDKEITRVAMDLRTPRPSRLPAAGQVQRGTLNYRGARGPASAARQYPSQQKPPASSGAGAATSSRGRDHRRYESSSWRKPNGRGRTTRR